MNDLLDPNIIWPETALIWGAGASQKLGLPGTEDIGKIISRLAGIGPGSRLQLQKPLNDRIKEAFKGRKLHTELEETFRDLLLLLFDGDDAKNDHDALDRHRKHVKNLAQKYAVEFDLARDDRDRLEHYLFSLHYVYDWVGVRGIAQYVARKWHPEKRERREISLKDLLTTVDQLYDANLAIPTEEIFGNENREKGEIYLVDKHRLLAAKRCLAHLTTTIQRVLIQESPGRIEKNKLKPYLTIARNLASLMREEAEAFAARGYQRNDRRFYYYSYAFVSFNWDPIMLWLLFHAHKEKNDAKIRIGESLLRFFNDSGDGIGIRRIFDQYDKGDKRLLAFMMNEGICQRINDPKYQGGEKSRLIRIGKLLFPHAGLGWRACSRCGKMFTDFGDTLDDPYSSISFGPDLLPEINKAWKPRTIKEDNYKKKGEFGAIQCIFCGSITQPYDSPLLLQSLIKSERHYIMEGIFRELGLVVGNAKHLVFAGYTLPSDDFIYRCFFQAAWAGEKASQDKKYCTLIHYDPEYLHLTPGNTGWLEGDDIIAYLESRRAKSSLKHILRRMLEIFEKCNLRVSLLGIPDVVTNFPGKDPREALIDLLYPRQRFPEGFPIERK